MVRLVTHEEKLKALHKDLLTFWAWIKQLPELTGDPDTDVGAWVIIAELAQQAWEQNGRSDTLMAWMSAHMGAMEQEAKREAEQTG